MALGTTNIAFATVKALLGDATDNYFLLCTSNKINKWSKYKPVRDAGTGTHWPATDIGNYALNVPTNWNYLQPRGGEPGGVSTGIDEPARLDDFRGYEHDRTLAYPSIQCRDTDNSWNANLYPSGSTYLNRWYCRAHRSASSVIIIPSDLGLDDYYVGLKVLAGSVWYKTFGQVKDLTFAKSWNASISCEIVNWDTSPAFSNFPYHIGAVDWQLILCSNAVSSWAGTGAGTVLYFTGIAVGGAVATYDTDGTNTYITSGSFTIKDWIKLGDYEMIFNGDGTPYQSAGVYISSENAFTISKSSWINYWVYDGGSDISDHPELWFNGNTIRVTCDPKTTACIVSPVVADGEDWSLNPDYTSGSLEGGYSRDGSVIVTSEGEDATIAVSQGYAGSDQLTWSFRSVDLSPSDADIDVVITRGATVVYSSSGVQFGRDGYTKTFTVTINEIGIPEETYTVTMSRTV